MEAINELAAALASAQAEIEPPVKNKSARVKLKSGGEYTFDYADLSAVMEAVRKPLAKHGLSLVHLIHPNGTGQELVTRLLHSSGQWLDSPYPLPVVESQQQFGSALTYAKRYSICGLLAIHADDDDDANLADKNEADIQQRTKPKLKENGAPPEVKPSEQKVKAGKAALIDAVKSGEPTKVIDVLKRVDEYAAKKEITAAGAAYLKKFVIDHICDQTLAAGHDGTIALMELTVALRDDGRVSEADFKRVDQNVSSRLDTLKKAVEHQAS